MAPLWDPEEAKSKIYSETKKHSEGMISFTYRPPSAADLEALKGTKTYRKLVQKHHGTLIQNAEKTVTNG